MMKEIIAIEREEDAVVVDTIVFPQLFELRLSHLPELTSFYHGNCTLEFHSLENLMIVDCPKMQTFVGSSTKRPKEASEEGLEGQIDQEGNTSITIQPFFNEKVVFPALESLDLSGLEKMEKIWHEQLLLARNFNRLTELSISDCEKLITIFPSSLGELLQNLVDLSVSYCDLLEDLCEGHNATSVTLPRINNFELFVLPSLKDVWWNKDCTESLNFQNLRNLTIGGCKCRRYLLSFTASKLLVQLQYLELVECDMVKEIIATEREEDAVVVDTIVFPKLFELCLSHLPELTSFYQGNCTLEFHSLQNLVIDDCPKMQIFVGSSTKRPKEASEEGLEGQTDQEGNSSITIQPFFNEKVVFPALESLHLRRLHKMEKIWHEQLLSARNFNRLTKLSISNCGKLITIFPSSLVQLLQNLVHLSVLNCVLLEDLCEGHNATSITLPRIKNFELLGIPSLKDLWWNKVCPESLNFQNLTKLTIGGCKCSRYLLSFTASKLLIQLEYLKLVECDMMKEIIATEREEDAVIVDTIVFPKLFELRLSQLPELTSFYKGNCTLEFHSLRTLGIKKCPKMRTFVGSSTKRSKEASEEGLEGQIDQEGNSNLTIQPFFNEKVVLPTLHCLTLQRLDNLKNIWQNELPVDCFNQLNVLIVRACNNLLEIVPFKLLPMLHNLSKLAVRECDLVEEVLEQGEDFGGKLVFPNVHTLELVRLPNLKSFYLGNHTLEWPSLTEVILKNCPKMQTFSSGLLITPKLNISL